MKKKVSKKAVFRIAGGFIAWVIGSGFATGQEALRFFSSYGFFGYGVVAINLIGFLALGYILMKTGFEHRDDKDFRHFNFFCGKTLGGFYNLLATGTLIILIPVLFSGAGATLNEYYGVNKYIGSAVMAAFVLAAYLIGFERLVKVISSIGPFIIVFSLIVGVATVIVDFGRFSEIPNYSEALSADNAAPHWILSAFVYLGLNFFPGSTYFVQLGTTARSERELKYGSVLGVIALIGSITVMSTAILLNGGATAELDIPVLYLARKLSYILGAVFSITLILGIFSSSSVMLWSVCSRFGYGGKKGNALFAVGITVLSYIISLFSFGGLVGTLYPLVGYVGLVFVGVVVVKGGIRHAR